MGYKYKLSKACDVCLSDLSGARSCESVLELLVIENVVILAVSFEVYLLTCSTESGYLAQTADRRSSVKAKIDLRQHLPAVYLV